MHKILYFPLYGKSIWSSSLIVSDELLVVREYEDWTPELPPLYICNDHVNSEGFVYIYVLMYSLEISTVIYRVFIKYCVFFP